MADPAKNISLADLRRSAEDSFNKRIKAMHEQLIDVMRETLLLAQASVVQIEDDAYNEVEGPMGDVEKNLSNYVNKGTITDLEKADIFPESLQDRVLGFVTSTEKRVETIEAKITGDIANLMGVTDDVVNEMTKILGDVTKTETASSKNIKEGQEGVAFASQINSALTKFAQFGSKVAASVATELMPPWQKRALKWQATLGLGAAAVPGAMHGISKMRGKGGMSGKALYTAQIVANAVAEIGTTVAKLVSEESELEAGYTKEAGNVSIGLATSFANAEAVPGLQDTIKESKRRAQGPMDVRDIVQEELALLDYDNLEEE